MSFCTLPRGNSSIVLTSCRLKQLQRRLGSHKFAQSDSVRQSRMTKLSEKRDSFPPAGAQWICYKSPIRCSFIPNFSIENND